MRARASLDDIAGPSQPPARRVAILVHGRIGIWRTRSSHIDDPQVVWMANAPHLWKQAPKSMDKIDLTPNSTLAGFAAFGRGSLWQHVIEPNKAAGLEIDCFLHSWHLEIGPQLDAMYRPIASQHDRVHKDLNSVKSQHLSMKIVLNLARDYALSRISSASTDGGGGGGRGARGAHGGGRGGRGDSRQRAGGAASNYYDLFMVTRYDILFFSPLLFSPLTSAPLWLPHWCHRYPLTAESGMIVRAACGNWPSHGEGYLVHPATTDGVFPPMKKKRITREANYDYAYLDWWLVAGPEVAMTFADIHDKFELYQAALQKIAPFPMWSHFYWGYHINRKLRMRQQLQYILYEGVDFRLARHWHFGTHCMHFLGSGGSGGGSGSGGGGSSGSGSGNALATIAKVGVDTSVYYRRIQGRRIASRGPGSSNGTLGPDAQPARQCPLDSRIRLYCPWLSPVCSQSIRETVLEVEAAAHVALVASTQLPPWPLFGDQYELEETRRETTLRRASTNRDSAGPLPTPSWLNRSRIKSWALT